MPSDEGTTTAGVIRALRRAILDGTHAPGSQLREAQLAAELGVSRGPLREAFSRLEEEGLIVRVAFRGAFVREVTAQTVREISDLRQLIEPEAVERAAEQLGDALPLQLDELVQALRSAADAGDLPATIESHLAFHRFFYEHSSNRLFAQMWADWETQLRLFLVVEHQQQHDLNDLAGSHERLVQLVRAGRMKQFRAELARHVHPAPPRPPRS
ncbi:GntR family transcriptional regulator [Jatrophihabitans sp.]|uniref:GntR family transcriptional regulator n=1 Tax=Jatrophihabitans sp. TaxID=1932789 RepID=UPI0030C7824E|nr:GntR family transcriptional regulator [Jatrophihabitans sp.]